MRPARGAGIPVAMAEFSSPTTRVHRSFLAAMAEFRAEGRGSGGDDTMVGSEIREHEPSWSTPEGFEVYVRSLRAQALEDSPRPVNHVPSTTLWWVEGTDYLGRLAIRHRLTPHLRDIGRSHRV